MFSNKTVIEMRSHWQRIVACVVAGLLLASCVENSSVTTEAAQFGLPIVEEVPTHGPVVVTAKPEPTVLPTPTVPDLPTMSSDDLSVTVEPESIILDEPVSVENPQIAEVDPADLPEEYYIRNITGHKQYYPLGCETSVSIDLAKYFGLEIIESEFQSRLPLSDNPDYGFVGSVEGPWGQVPPYAYGVHAGPIADLLREYGLNAVGEKNFTIEQIKAEIASGQPVIAWVIGNVVGGIPYEYTDSQGRKVIVAAYEHVVIMTGYSDKAGTLRYMNNGKFYDVPVEHFDQSWAVLGRMVVYVGD